MAIEPKPRTHSRQRSRRVVRMVNWLRCNEHQIIEIDKGKIRLDFAGDNLVVRLESTEQIEKEKI